MSLENVLLDVKELGRGMELIRRECSIHDNSVLRNFLSTNEGKLDKLQRDAKTAEVGKGWRQVGAVFLQVNFVLVLEPKNFYHMVGWLAVRGGEGALAGAGWVGSCPWGHIIRSFGSPRLSSIPQSWFSSFGLELCFL